VMLEVGVLERVRTGRARPGELPPEPTGRLPAPREPPLVATLLA
jgi:hypothetical protein